MKKNSTQKSLDAIEQLIKECVANQSLKECIKQVIQSNPETENCARRVLNNYKMEERHEALNRLVDLVLCDSITYQTVLDAKGQNPLDFFMLVHAYTIRQKLGLDKEITLDTVPF